MVFTGLIKTNVIYLIFNIFKKIIVLKDNDEQKSPVNSKNTN